MIAELAAFGKSSPWPFRRKSEADAEMSYWVDWLDAQQRIQMLWTGRLESLPVRRWYEAKKAKDKDRGKGALIAVARKLTLALHAVGARGEPFEPWRLFPGRSLARKFLQAKRKAAARLSSAG